MNVSVCDQIILSTSGIGEHPLYGWMNGMNDRRMTPNSKYASNKRVMVFPHVQQAKDFYLLAKNSIPL